MVVGDPCKPDTRVGPLIHPDHFARVEGFVDRARSEGVQILWGGGRHNQGELYFQPTLIAGARRDQEIFQSEVFGPVLTWNTFDNDDEVIDLIAMIWVGRGDFRRQGAATLFSGNEDRAMRIASGVVAGTVWVNCYFIRELAAPFGGARNSGIGREGGTWSFDFFCDIKNIAVRKNSFG
jgi:acyl-CoA reductase-like NAD-dependent aldehyde dehydrogenase